MPTEPAPAAFPLRARRLLLALLALVVFAGLSAATIACDARLDEERPHLVSFTPSEDTDEPTPLLVAVFDRPLTTEAEVGKTLAASPVVLAPPVEVEAFWRDRQTLVLKPTGPLEPATRYTASFAGLLGAPVAQETDRSFVHAPFRFVGLQDTEARWFPVDGRFRMEFNQSIAPREVARGCRLEDPKGTSGFALTAAAGDPEARIVSLSTEEPLPQGAALTLACERLWPSQGNAPLGTALAIPLRVRPTLTLSKLGPEETDELSPDDLELMVETSTPIEPEELARHLTLTPPVHGFATGWTERGPGLLMRRVTLEAKTAYRLVLDEDVTDRFGQRLGAPAERRFTTSTPAPRLFAETGIHVIERGRSAPHAGLPVWSRNVGEAELECARVPRERLVSLLTGKLDLSAYWSDGRPPRALPWTDYGLSPKTTALGQHERSNAWEETRVALSDRCGGGASAGVFLAELRSPDVLRSLGKERYGQRYPLRVLGNVTNLGVVLKVGPSSGLVWVTALDTGAVVPGATVTLLSAKGETLARGDTDAEGLLRVEGTAKLLAKERARAASSEEDEYEWSPTTQRVFALVEKDDDLAILDAEWNDGVQAWSYGEGLSTGPGAALRGFLLTDRGIYRPGETVHFKGLAREVKLGARPRTPSEKSAKIIVRDARGTVLLEREETLSRFGGFAFDVRLGAEAVLGEYDVTATVGAGSFRESFSVQEVRPLSFDLAHRTPEDPRRDARKPVEVLFSAEYLFGAPVKDAAVSWTVSRRSATPSFSAFPEFTFEGRRAYGYYDYDYDGELARGFVADGKTTTDEQGRLAFTFQDSDRKLDGLRDYLVEVEARDAAGDVVTRRAALRAHATDLYFGLRQTEWVQVAKRPFSVDVLAVDEVGRPLATQATLDIVRTDWNCTRQNGSPWGGWSCKEEETLVASRPLALGAAPRAESVTLDEPGEYLLRLRSADRAGRPVALEDSLWVVGAGNAHSWREDESVRMELVQSKKRYAPGDIARLVPRAPVAGATALVTRERDGVLDARVVKLGQGMPAIEVPLEARHAPNVFVSVMTVRGRTSDDPAGRPTLRAGLANLSVSAEAERLRVELSTEKATYEPGESVRGTVRVLSGTKPVRAEVSLSVADEGVLRLIDFATPDPMARFYAPWAVGVESSANWLRLLAYQKPFHDDGENGGDGASATTGRVRSNFVASAFWAPLLQTDAAGRVRFEFTAPDNLTSFRLMAAAADEGARFGSGEGSLRVRKALMVRPTLPRFFHEGDEAEIGAVVDNFTGETGTATVTFSTPGLSPAELTRTVELPSNDSRALRFSVRVPSGQRSVTFQAKAMLGTARDAVERTLPVRRALVTEPRLALASHLDPRGGTARATLAWPDGTFAEDSTVRIDVDRTGLSDLAPGLRYLVAYPYGCLEQTLSRALPLFSVRDLAKAVGDDELVRSDQLDAFIEASISKVLKHQHDDGHFSLWPDAATRPELTAYALFGLSQAKQAGLAVPDEPVRLGLSALGSWANDSRRRLADANELDTLAMAADTLSSFGEGDEGLMARLFEHRGAMPAFGRALLARALTRAGGHRLAGTLLTELTAALPAGQGAALVREPTHAHHWSSDTRTSAALLLALVEKPRRGDLAAEARAAAPRLALGLKAERLGSGAWRNTQDNLYAILALAAYARSLPPGKTTVAVSVDGRQVGQETLSGSKALSLVLPAEELRQGAVEVTTDGLAEVAVTQRIVRAEGPFDFGANGLSVSRVLLDHATGQELRGEARVGQLVRVRLHVRSDGGARDVALTDPLPAGFEVVNLRLATEGAGGRDAPRNWLWDHEALRDDRAEAFGDVGRDGTFEYLARAMRPGEYAVPGPFVEAMYAPERWGRALESHVRITDATAVAGAR